MTIIVIVSVFNFIVGNYFRYIHWENYYYYHRHYHNYYCHHYFFLLILVHMSICPSVMDYEPEGDETVLCEGKPIGKKWVWIGLKRHFWAYIRSKPNLSFENGLLFALEKRKLSMGPDILVVSHLSQDRITMAKSLCIFLMINRKIYIESWTEWNIISTWSVVYIGY